VSAKVCGNECAVAAHANGIHLALEFQGQGFLAGLGDDVHLLFLVVAPLALALLLVQIFDNSIVHRSYDRSEMNISGLGIASANNDHVIGVLSH
jgi:hypothetical protein